MNSFYTKYIASTETVNRAKRESLNKELRNSIRGKENGYVARLGEILVEKITGGILKNTYDYDLILKNNLKADVKTKERKVDPKPHYEVSVADFNTSQKCDIYIFVSINTKSIPHAGFVVGWLDKDDFYRKARFCKKGDFDSDNNFTFKADCYNLSFAELNPLKNLINYATT